MCAKGVTMKDIAKEAGVSQSAVSMILNQKTSSFPTETIEKVLSTAAKMNYNFRTSPKTSSIWFQRGQRDYPKWRNRHDIPR